MDSKYLISLVQTVLQHSGIHQKQKDIYRILCSDERYPSALSVIKTLAYWGVNANAYQADLESLQNEKGVKIVHLDTNGGRFFIVKEIQNDNITIIDNHKMTLSQDAFIKLWDGYVIIAETERKNHTGITFSKRIAVLLCFFVYLLAVTPDKTGTLIDLTGVSISYILLFHSIYTFTSLPLCVIGRSFDCNSVADSSPFSKRIPVNLPLLSLWYFISDILLVIFNISKTANNIMCLCALPVVVYLLLYQLVFIKKKCLYCMLVSLCIMLKALTVLTLADLCLVNIESQEIPAIGFVVVLSLIITSLINDKMIASEKEIKGDMSLLRQKRKSSITLILNGDNVNLSSNFCMSLGHHDAPIKIDTVVSSECLHCLNLVSDMFRLIQKHSQYVQWNIYWTKLGYDETREERNPNNLALTYIQDYLDDKCDLRKYPYKENDIRNHPISEQTKSFLDSSTSYLRELNISSYPQVYVNHKHIASDYSISDLEVIINDWIMEEAVSL